MASICLGLNVLSKCTGCVQILDDKGQKIWVN